MRHAARLTHGHDDRVGIACRAYRLVDHLSRRALVLHHLGAVPVQEVQIADHAGVVGHVGAARVYHLALAGQRVAHTLQQRDGLTRLARSGPATQDVDLRVGQRADHGHLA